MMKVVDNLIALRIIYLLTTPFEETNAFKLGLIDANGKQLKRASSAEEKASTSMLHRLVWNIKKIINLAPGGSTKIGSLAAAYLLVKEGLDNGWTENRIIYESSNRFEMLSNIRLLEEEVIVEESLKRIKEIEEDAVANATGPAVSTDQPVVKKKTQLPILTRKKI